jgi:Putative bacterial sensory transduction regulator
MKLAVLLASCAMIASPAGAQTATPGTWKGLTVAEITGQLTASGLVVEAPRVLGDRVYIPITDGAVRSVVTLFSCTDGACPDVQFTAAFSGPQATPDIVSRWNAERRFVKAFYAFSQEENEGQAVAQYDVLLNPVIGPAQLDDPIQVWRSLANDLGRTVTVATTTGTALPPAQ